MRLINGRELKRRYMLDGARATCTHLRNALIEGHLAPEDFELRELAESLIEDGSEWVRTQCDPRMQGSFTLIEAAGAVDTTAFSNITGQLVFTEIRKQFDMPEFIGGKICRTVPTRLSGEKIPGISGLGDAAAIVPEGKGYAVAGPNEEYVQTPATTKRGFIVPVTKEAIFFDLTGVLLDRCRAVGYWLALNKEKRILGQVLGLANAGVAVTATYNRNGTTYNSYQTTSPWINDRSGNALSDWTKIETVMLGFDGLTDPNTGEVISVMPRTLIVPSALRFTARRIVDADEVDHSDATTGSWKMTRSKNPVQGLFDIVTSPLVKAASGSATKWWMGDFQRAFEYRENWPITVVQAPVNSEAEFTHDIVARFKASERGVATAVEPRYAARSDA